jgi:hypothetical protein
MWPTPGYFLIAEKKAEVGTEIGVFAARVFLLRRRTPNEAGEAAPEVVQIRLQLFVKTTTMAQMENRPLVNSASRQAGDSAGCGIEVT